MGPGPPVKGDTVHHPEHCPGHCCPVSLSQLPSALLLSPNDCPPSFGPHPPPTAQPLSVSRGGFLEHQGVGRASSCLHLLGNN